MPLSAWRSTGTAALQAREVPKKRRKGPLLDPHRAFSYMRCIQRWRPAEHRGGLVRSHFPARAPKESRCTSPASCPTESSSRACSSLFELSARPALAASDCRCTALRSIRIGPRAEWWATGSLAASARSARSSLLSCRPQAAADPLRTRHRG